MQHWRPKNARPRSKLSAKWGGSAGSSPCAIESSALAQEADDGQRDLAQAEILDGHGEEAEDTHLDAKEAFLEEVLASSLVEAERLPLAADIQVARGTPASWKG